MKEGFEHKLFKNYNLTPAEQNTLDKFLEENLEKDISDHVSHLWRRPFSLFQKRMENFNLVKTTDI
jgi:hypothetical protein